MPAAQFDTRLGRITRGRRLAAIRWAARATLGETIRIQIPDHPDPTGTTVHRFRNFGEDIYRALRDTCSVDIHEIDRCTSVFWVRDIREKDLGSVGEIIERELRRHYFFETASVVRE